jgi:hypothetical protein
MSAANLGAPPPAGAPSSSSAPPLPRAGGGSPLTWSHSRSIRFMRVGNACNGAALVAWERMLA